MWLRKDFYRILYRKSIKLKLNVMIKEVDKEEKQVAEESGGVVERVEHKVKSKRRQNEMTTHEKQNKKKTEGEGVESRPIWFMNRR